MKDRLAGVRLCVNAKAARLYLRLRGAGEKYLRSLAGDEKGSVVEYVLLAMVGIMTVAALWSIMRPWITNIWLHIASE